MEIDASDCLSFFSFESREERDVLYISVRSEVRTVTVRRERERSGKKVGTYVSQRRRNIAMMKCSDQA